MFGHKVIDQCDHPGRFALHVKMMVSRRFYQRQVRILVAAVVVRWMDRHSLGPGFVPACRFNGTVRYRARMTVRANTLWRDRLSAHARA